MTHARATDRRSLRHGALAAAILVTGAPALAQSASGSETTPATAAGAPSPLSSAAPQWKLKLEPSLWFAGPGGKLRMPGQPAGGSRIDLSKLNLDSPRPTPAFEIDARPDGGPWRIGGFVASLSTRDRGLSAETAGQIGSIPFAAGQRLSSSFNYFAAQVVVARSIELPASLKGTPGVFETTVEPYVGLRVQNFDLKFNSGSAETSTNEFYASPLVGVRVAVDVQRDFTIDLRADVGAMALGGGRSITGSNIALGFQWRPVDAVGVQIGYRIQIYDARAGRDAERFLYKGSVAGLFAGVVFRF